MEARPCAAPCSGTTITPPGSSESISGSAHSATRRPRVGDAVTPHGELPTSRGLRRLHPDRLRLLVNDPEHRCLSSSSLHTGGSAAERVLACFGQFLRDASADGSARIPRAASSSKSRGACSPDGGPPGSYRILRPMATASASCHPAHAGTRRRERPSSSASPRRARASCPSAPELSVPEVRDRIVATREADGRLLPDEARRARATLATGHDGPQLLAAISRFLRSRAPE